MTPYIAALLIVAAALLIYSGLVIAWPTIKKEIDYRRTERALIRNLKKRKENQRP